MSSNSLPPGVTSTKRVMETELKKPTESPKSSLKRNGTEIKDITDEPESSSEGPSSKEVESRLNIAPPIGDDFKDFRMDLDEPISISDVSSEKGEVKVYEKDQRLKAHTHHNPSPLTKKLKGKKKASEPSSDSSEDVTITPTQKRGKESPQKKIPIPKWSVNSEEVTIAEKIVWKLAPENTPARGYDVPDVMSKDVLKAQKVQKIAEFMGEFIKLKQTNSMHHGM